MSEEEIDPPFERKGPQPASISATAFICPYCETHTTQHWYQCHVREYEKGRTPPTGSASEWQRFLDKNPHLDRDEHSSILDYVNKLASKTVFFEPNEEYLTVIQTGNLSLSQCYECDQIAIWASHRLVWPPHRSGVVPNSDLSDAVKALFEEARSILDLSPRGSAALLRLAIDKLTLELGAEGDDLNKRIGDLVRKGLDRRIQMALDAVRVIGNEAVHPGAMDLSDERETAEILLGLVNLIAEKMLSEEKHLVEVYSLIPPGKRKGIENRDKKK